MQVLCSCSLSAIPAKFILFKREDLKPLKKIKNIYTCPKCGHPIEEWGRHKWKAGGIFGLHWPCKNCGTILGLNPWQRTILILVCATSLYLLFRLATPFQVGLFVLSIVLGIFLLDIFLVSIVEKPAVAEYIPRVMKGISACPKCGHLVGLRHRWNTAYGPAKIVARCWGFDTGRARFSCLSLPCFSTYGSHLM